MGSSTEKSLKRKDYKFLLGLNKELDEVRGRIMVKPLPNVRKAFSDVRMEESRKKVIMGPQITTHILEGSTLLVQGP